MISIKTSKLEIEADLRKKIEIICSFNNLKPKFINGTIRNIDKTNLSYIEPHRVIINNIVVLLFNYSRTIYINNLSNKMDISKLQSFLKTIW